MALEPQEVITIFNTIDKTTVLGYRDFALFTLIYSYGLRISEAIAIDLDDISFDDETMTIHGKGGKDRKLPLVDEIITILSKWLSFRKYMYNSNTISALFVSKKGNRLAVRTAQENFQKLVKKAGPFSLKKVTPHSLRHAFASHAIENESDLVVIKAILGHACMQSTEIYLHPSILMLQKAINDHVANDILGELLDNNKNQFVRVQRINYHKKIA